MALLARPTKLAVTCGQFRTLVEPIVCDNAHVEGFIRIVRCKYLTKNPCNKGETLELSTNTCVQSHLITKCRSIIIPPNFMMPADSKSSVCDCN